MLKRLVVHAVLLCIGSGLGWGIAEYLRKADYDKILDVIKSFPNTASSVYAVRRLPSEGSCSGKLYTFYSKGFEVLEMRSMGYDEFMITTSAPTTIELARNCMYVRNRSEDLSTALLGVYLTIPVKAQLFGSVGGEKFIPVGGERNDALFDRIMDIQTLKSDFYSVERATKYNFSTNAEEYENYPATSYRYQGRLGIATIKAEYRKYHLVENKKKVSTLFIISIALGGLLGLIMAFTTLKFGLKFM